MRGKIREYDCWLRIRSKCHNPRDKYFPRYGGRGIAVCERWRKSFAAFYEDMGPRPSANHSIERIDNDGNYEPNNCEWALRSEQQGNRRPFVEWAIKDRAAWTANAARARAMRKR
jgi:hypothetical protein